MFVLSHYDFCISQLRVISWLQKLYLRHFGHIWPVTCGFNLSFFPATPWNINTDTFCWVNGRSEDQLSNWNPWWLWHDPTIQAAVRQPAASWINKKVVQALCWCQDTFRFTMEIGLVSHFTMQQRVWNRQIRGRRGWLLGSPAGDIDWTLSAACGVWWRVGVGTTDAQEKSRRQKKGRRNTWTNTRGEKTSHTQERGPSHSCC